MQSDAAAAIMAKQMQRSLFPVPNSLAKCPVTKYMAKVAGRPATGVHRYLVGGALRLLEGRQQTLVALTPLLEDLLQLLRHACNAVVHDVAHQVRHTVRERQSQSDCVDIIQPTSYGSGAFCAGLASAGGAKLTATAAAAAASRPRRLAIVTSASGSAAAQTVANLRSRAAMSTSAIWIATLHSITSASTGCTVGNEAPCQLQHVSAVSYNAP